VAVSVSFDPKQIELLEIEVNMIVGCGMIVSILVIVEEPHSLDTVRE
jgi:hypothetical protein